jgi:hypothetical protein
VGLESRQQVLAIVPLDTEECDLHVLAASAAADSADYLRDSLAAQGRTELLKAEPRVAGAWNGG